MTKFRVVQRGDTVYVEPDPDSIVLNDLLHLSNEQIENTKIRFMTPSEDCNFDPVRDSENPELQNKINLTDLVFNRSSSISFKEGVIAIGFIPLGGDRWLMTGVVKVLKDNGFAKKADAEYLITKYNYRVIVEFHKDFQNGIVLAKNVIDKLRVIEVTDKFSCKFPGYKNLTVSYEDLKRRIDSPEWSASLRARKGVYLITDRSNGKLYVGSASGDDGLYGRWKTYVESGYDKKGEETGEYPNKGLRELVEKEGMNYVKKNFQYSILETFTEETPTKDIIDRENWWKEALLSRAYGYNNN